MIDEPMTDPGLGDLDISERLAGLLLWLLEEQEYEVAAEAIDKPWHWARWADAHEANPDLRFAEIDDLMRRKKDE